MADDPLKAMREKQARLLREAQEVEKDLHEFERIAKKHGIKIGSEAQASQEAPAPANGTVSYRSKKAQIEGEASKYLKTKGRRAQSGEIAKALIARGVNLGKTPNKTLAAYLTRSPEFDNSPAAGGYGLIETRSDGENLPLTH
jgi:hypothetical protein